MAEKQQVNIFDAETLEQLREWSVGEPITARKLNAPVRKLNSAFGTAKRGQQIVRPRASPPVAATSASLVRVEITQPCVQGKYHRCIRRNGDGTTSPVLVAMPPELESSTWIAGEDGITYSFLGTAPVFQNRRAQRGNVVEFQRIVPFYRIGSIIYADRPINGTGIMAPEGEDGEMIELSLVEVSSARKWSEVFS